MVAARRLPADFRAEEAGVVGGVGMVELEPDAGEPLFARARRRGVIGASCPTTRGVLREERVLRGEEELSKETMMCRQGRGDGRERRLS